MKSFKGWLALAGLAVAAPALAQDSRSAAPPEVFNRVTACQAIRDDAGRLACFDQAVAALSQAQTAREVVVVGREEVQRTRRSLFGLTLPDVGRLLGDGAGENEINSRVVAAQFDRQGRVSFQIEGGAVWVQTDGRPLARAPRPGMAVRIRRAALGSFLANVEGQTAIRVTRQR